MIADLLLRDEEVWLLDEFCNDLDPITAKIVAHNLRKQIHCKRVALLFIASAKPTPIISTRCGQVGFCYFARGDQPAWLSFKEYQNEFSRRGHLSAFSTVIDKTPYSIEDALAKVSVCVEGAETSSLGRVSEKVNDLKQSGLPWQGPGEYQRGVAT